MSKKTAGWILGGLAVVITVTTAITQVTNVAETADALIVSEAEAEEAHGKITLASEQAQQTQAGFNAYTLRLLLEQEIAVLELQIEAEEDETEKELLEVELKAKQTFIRQLEDEERRQMMKSKI